MNYSKKRINIQIILQQSDFFPPETKKQDQENAHLIQLQSKNKLMSINFLQINQITT